MDEAREKPPVPDRLESAVLAAVSGAQRRRPLIAVERDVAARWGIPVGRVRETVRRLVDDGRLSYYQSFGTTLVGPSCDRGIQVTRGVRLRPPGRRPSEGLSGLEIVLQAGAAFGDGTHPTTALALELLERHLTDPPGIPGAQALDIGTGSGVLAIAIALWSGLSVLAIDTDSCARHEARQNVAYNDLSSRVSVEDRPLGGLTGSFGVVAANLRYPTLKTLPQALGAATGPGCLFVCSGLIGGEGQRLETHFAGMGLSTVGRRCRGRWGAVAFRKIPL